MAEFITQFRWLSHDAPGAPSCLYVSLPNQLLPEVKCTEPHHMSVLLRISISSFKGINSESFFLAPFPSPLLPFPILSFSSLEPSTPQLPGNVHQASGASCQVGLGGSLLGLQGWAQLHHLVNSAV